MTTNKELVHRLNRIVGQINGLSNRIEAGEDKDCVKTIQQLKASINALKKFGEAYVMTHMDDCLNDEMNPEKMKEDLSSVIKRRVFFVVFHFYLC